MGKSARGHNARGSKKTERMTAIDQGLHLKTGVFSRARRRCRRHRGKTMTLILEN
jgi:hypothetical protein